jgi:hypothetical protein
MIVYINSRIKATSVYNIFKGIVWIMVALSLVYVFNFWYKAPTEGYLWIGIIIFDILFLLLVIAGVWEIVISIKCLYNPASHEAYKLLKKYEQQSDLYENINKELVQHIKPFSNMLLTKNWLFKNSNSDIEPIFIADIVWAYEKKITTTLNTIITVGKDFYIVLHTAKGQEVEIPVKKTEVETFLYKIHELNQITRLGYTDENKLWWENNAPKNNN